MSYAKLDGIDMYYEIHGRGDTPLVLIHGGGSTIDVTFGKVLPLFARNRMVIALEEQGHGRTTDRDQPVRFETTADDVAALLEHLKIAQADLFGFSNGAGSALQVAIRHPRLVRKLVFASFFTKKSGGRPFLWEHIANGDFAGMPQPLKDAFLAVNPDESKLRSMCEKDLERMRTFQDIPDDLVRSVKAQTLILLGDQDVVEPQHAIELSHLIEDSRLLIVPGGHGDFIGELLTPRPDSQMYVHVAGLIEEFLASS